MSPQEARDLIRASVEIDPDVRRRADRLVCELLGEPEISAGPNGSLILRWHLDGITTVATISKDQG